VLVVYGHPCQPTGEPNDCEIDKVAVHGRHVCSRPPLSGAAVLSRSLSFQPLSLAVELRKRGLSLPPFALPALNAVSDVLSLRRGLLLDRRRRLLRPRRPLELALKPARFYDVLDISRSMKA
jgi:hypothetical protein